MCIPLEPQLPVSLDLEVTETLEFALSQLLLLRRPLQVLAVPFELLVELALYECTRLHLHLDYL